MEIIVRDFYDEGKLRKCSDTVYQLDTVESLASGYRRNLGVGDNERQHEIFFITGQKNKVIELEENIKLKHVKFTNLKVDLIEIQHSNVLDIVQDKCERAFQHVNRLSGQPKGLERSGPGDGDRLDGASREAKQNNYPVLVEDTSLNFAALHGMPGPYIKWFTEAVGCDGLHRMLVGFEDKSAEAVCIYALQESEKRIVFFRGIAPGRIVEPRGTSWGWDAVFEEERSNKTFAEMDVSMKSKFSHRASACALLKKYLALLQ